MCYARRARKVPLTKGTAVQYNTCGNTDLQRNREIVSYSYEWMDSHEMPEM